jgi:hypothetical protein
VRTQLLGFLRIPPFARPNAAAYGLGQYRNLEMADKTLVCVSRDTRSELFKTRDTVAVETPASLATSFTVDDWLFIPAVMFITWS